MARMTADGEIAEAGGIVVVEEAGPAERLDQERIHILAQQRHQHKDRPQAINDAGNGGQQFGEKGQRPAQKAGAHFGEEDGDADGQRNRQQQRQKRGNQRAVDERQGAEVAVDRIPVRRQTGGRVDVGLVEELEAEGVPGKLGALDQLDGNERHDGEDAERAEHHERTEKRRRQWRSCRAQAGSGGWPSAPAQCTADVWLRRSRGGFRLSLGLGDTNLRHVGVHRGQATGEI